MVKVLRQDGGRRIEAEVNRCCFVHCIRFLLTSPYCKAFIYTHTPIYISIVNNHTLLSEEQSLTEGRGGEAVRREESTKWRAARGGAGRARRSFYLLERLFAEVERAKARSKFPSCGRSCLEVGRERAGGAARVKGGQAMFLLYSQAIAQVIRVKDSPGRLASVGAREKCHPCSSCAGQPDPVAIPKDSLCLR